MIEHLSFCHFANDALKRISEEIYNYIVSEGTANIFYDPNF